MRGVLGDLLAVLDNVRAATAVLNVGRARADSPRQPSGAVSSRSYD
jgi:hypothetical protein